jgi:hypothetical protein
LPPQPTRNLDFLSTLAPDAIILQYDYEATFFWNSAFGHVPPLTVFADGTVFYVDSGNPPSGNNQLLMIARLTSAEIRTLLQHVLNLGFEHLESHLDHCDGSPESAHTCAVDASYSIIRVRLSSETVREIKNYADFANDPHALRDLRTFLSTYHHPTAQPYHPALATLLIRKGTVYDSPPITSWTSASPWVAPTQRSLNGQWVMVLAGVQLDDVLAQLPHNMGEYVVRIDGNLYTLMLTPWLPYQDYTSDILTFQRSVTP